MLDDYMNTEETANFLGVKRQTVEYWRKKECLCLTLSDTEKTVAAAFSTTVKNAYFNLPLFTLSKTRTLNGKLKRTANKLQTKSQRLLQTLLQTENCKRIRELQITTELRPDKKNYATGGADKIISANNSETNSITIVNEKQSRIAETLIFFNQLYGKIPEPHFAYLITFKDRIKTYSFPIADEPQREAIAKKAIELANNGFEVWHSVNPVCIEPSSSKRGDELAVSYQIAIVVDIDIRSDAHKGDPSFLAADFDEAKSFLPFTPSLIISSGYGLHAYYIFDTPIKITNENREELNRRNNLLLEVIRARANGKKIDGVGDLPRVLRTPCTFNYKLGTYNAPMCHITEDSGLRFSPTDLLYKSNIKTRKGFGKIQADSFLLSPFMWCCPLNRE